MRIFFLICFFLFPNILLTQNTNTPKDRLKNSSKIESYSCYQNLFPIESNRTQKHILANDITDTLSMVYNYPDDIILTKDDWGQKCIRMNNYTISLGNGLVDETGRRGFTLACYDTLGNRIWTKLVEDSNDYIIQGNAIESLNNNSFYVGGIIYNDTLEPWDRFIAKFDMEGSMLFFKPIIDDTASNYIVDMVRFSDDTMLVLSAWQQEMYAEYAKIVLDFIDVNGNILYTSQDPADIKHHRQLLIHNDKIYVGGTKKTQPGSYYFVKVFINRYDLQLNYLGSTTPSWTLNEYFKGLISFNDGLVLTSGVSVWYPPDPRLHYKPNLSHLSQYGNILDTNLFGPASIHESLGGPTIYVTDNLLVTDVSQGFFTELYYHDANLNTFCRSTLEMPISDFDYAYLHDLVPVGNNKLYGTGAIYYYDYTKDQDSWTFLTENVVHYTDSSCVHVGIQENLYFQEYKCNFKVYLCTAGNSIIIKRTSDRSLEATLVLFDMHGNQLISSDFMNETKINIEGYARGMYIIRLITKKGIETHKVIK